MGCNDQLKAISKQVEEIGQKVNAIIIGMQAAAEGSSVELVLNGAQECKLASQSLSDAVAAIESVLQSGAVGDGLHVPLAGLVQGATPEQFADALVIAKAEVAKMADKLLAAKAPFNTAQDIDGDVAMQCENCIDLNKSRSCQKCSDFNHFRPNPERFKGCHNCGTDDKLCHMCFQLSNWSKKIELPDKTCRNCGRMCMGCNALACDDWEPITEGTP